MTIQSEVSELHLEQMARRADMAQSMDTFLQLFIPNIIKSTKIKIILL